MLDQFFSQISFVDIFNFCVFLTFTICYTYQLYYVFVVLTRRAPKQRRARTQPPVRRRRGGAQRERRSSPTSSTPSRCRTIPRELIDVFVIADNCTDNTADVAREAGAIVFPRFNTEQVGKGYALDYGFKAIREQYADRGYEAYLRLRRRQRARRELLPRDERHLRQRREGLHQLPQLQELRQQLDLRRLRRVVPARGEVPEPGAPHAEHQLRRVGHGLLHRRRHHREATAAGSGTCSPRTSSSPPTPSSTACASATRPTAVLYDEQPITFRDSWNQRFRWAKGFYQVFAHYAARAW